MSLSDYSTADLLDELKRRIDGPLPPTVNASRVLQEVASEYRVTVGDIRSERRPAYLVRARKEAYRRLREEGLTYAEIALVCGRKDHSTVWHALRGRGRR